MPKFILVRSTGGAADAPVFATALSVARTFGSHLAFLHVRPDVRQEFAALAAAEVGVVSAIGDTMERMEQEADRLEHDAERAWHDFCDREKLPLRTAPPADGVSVEWINEIGADPAWIAAHGRTADLVVAGRGATVGGHAMEVLEAALMDTGHPVLIAPAKPPASVGRIVAIAWKDTREAAAGVSAALPFIAKAQRVIILTVDEGNNEDDRSPELLQRALRWHNANVLVHRLVIEARSPSETLLRAVAHAEADLLVMGGYGHTRLREAVFGGFTRHVLERATLPVLMAH
jgi:nucleotide-binding universal stress UspA family protein